MLSMRLRSRHNPPAPPPDRSSFEAFLAYYGIRQAHVSDALSHLLPRLYDKYGLGPILDSTAPTVFVGLYYPSDIIRFRSHAPGKRFMRPGGSDANKAALLQKLPDEPPIFAVSLDLQARLRRYGAQSTYARWDIVDRRLFRPVPLAQRGNKIYVYNGPCKGTADNIRKRAYMVYGQGFVDEVARRRPQYELIQSNEHGWQPYDAMPAMYGQCCIALRLTKHDGTANMVQELSAMGIPVVHNQSEYGLKWDNVEDVIMHVDAEMERAGRSSALKAQAPPPQGGPTPEPPKPVPAPKLETPPPAPAPATKLKGPTPVSKPKAPTLAPKLKAPAPVSAPKPQAPTPAPKPGVLGQALVISSTQYPGYGGAATNAYELIKAFRAAGHKTVGIFFHNAEGVAVDPDAIGGVFVHPYKHDADRVRKDATGYLGSPPALCLAKNYLAPQFCKAIFGCRTVYLVSGINHFRLFFPEKTGMDVLDPSFQLSDDQVFKHEVKTLEMVDEAVNNSRISNDIFRKFYPQYLHKIRDGYVDTTASVLEVPIQEKKYDVVLACSRLDRVQKNNMAMLEVLSRPEMASLTKLVVGGKEEAFGALANVTVTGLLDHKMCVTALAQSRVLLFPSRFDSNSNTVREAYHHGCLPIITPNVGYSELFPDDLVCRSYDVAEWAEKLIHVLHHYEELCRKGVPFPRQTNLSTLLG